jgi:hypothetical protein
LNDTPIHHASFEQVRFLLSYFATPINTVSFTFLSVPLDKSWFDLQFHKNEQIKKPDELENEIADPPELVNENILDKINGSLIGMTLGDALGARVEFRPHGYLVANPVTDLEGGGTWGLKKGQVLCRYCIFFNRENWNKVS